MNIRQQLLQRNSRANADIVLAYVTKTPTAIVELMACFLSDEVTVAQRASQIVGDLGRLAPESLKPWWDEMARAAEQPVHDAVCRNVARYFSELQLSLPPELERSLVQLLTGWSCNLKTPVAITVFSMQFIANRADRFPQEANQIRTQIESSIDTGSAAFKNRGRTILNQLKN